MTVNAPDPESEFFEDEPAHPRGNGFVTLAGSTELHEDIRPDTRATSGFGSPRSIDVTRHKLAMGMLVLVGLLALLPTLAMIGGRWTHFSYESFRALNLVFTPVVALASAAFGFFFASDDRNRL